MSQDTSRQIPRRSDGVSSRAVGNDFVVIEPTSQTAHALSGLAAEVWAASADGQWTGTLTSEVTATIDELTSLGLLRPPTGISRRHLLTRIGAGAGATAIISMALPEAMAAATVLPTINQVYTTPNTCTTFVVPAGVTYLNVVVNGGGGGGGGYLSPAGGLGGGGASISGRLVNLTAGRTITVVVGAGGGGATAFLGGTGGAGYATGGNGTFALTGGGGGAGASAVGVAAGTLASCTVGGVGTQSTIAIVAGGGGGGSGNFGDDALPGTTTNSGSVAPTTGQNGKSILLTVGGGGGGGGTGTATATTAGEGGPGGKSYWTTSAAVLTNVSATTLNNGGSSLFLGGAGGGGSVTLSFP